MEREQGSTPVDVPEMQTAVQSIMDRIKNKDPDQYSDLLLSIGDQAEFLNNKTFQIICLTYVQYVHTINYMKFEWDKNKNSENIQKHKIDFNDVVEVFQQGRRIKMKPDTSKKKSKTDWDKLNSMSDSEINYSDIPELNESFFKNGKLRMPKTKPRISIRLDPDVLEWFKSHGVGYQTRINAVLRMYMEAHKQNQ